MCVACVNPWERLQIVVCTDGLANVGLGSIEDSPVPEDAPADATPASIAEQFYARVGAYAVTNGTTIDVIGCVSTACSGNRDRVVVSRSLSVRPDVLPSSVFAPSRSLCGWTDF